MALIGDKKEIRKALRKKDIDIIFDKCPDGVFAQGLELGSGDGYQSQFLKRYVKSLIVTDKEAGSMANKVTGIDFRQMDALEIDRYFEEDSLDLLFSSNALEHIPDISRLIEKMSLVLRDEGLMIHSMPNTLWKLLQFVLFIPAKIRNILNRVMKKGKDFYDQPDFLERGGFPELFPSSHGRQKNTFKEFYYFSRKYWISTFQKNDFEILNIIKLQFHSPYRLGCPALLRKYFENAGIVTTYAYILKKANKKTYYEKNILSKT